MTTTAAQYENVSVALIVPSGTNPRRHFDKKALEELTNSVKDHGVIEPVVVRKNGHESGFLLVAGERRWRAAKGAGLKEIPAVVRELTDAQALEIQVIENLQREDIHPLDEAMGYKKLIEVTGQNVEKIADKVGKSASYVYQRLKLADLIPDAQKLFLEDVITAGHAILIARLGVKDQRAILDSQFDDNHMKYGNAPSVRRLAELITSEIHLRLVNVPWKLDDKDLLPEAGACLTCPKRTGANPALFPDIKDKDACTDSSCFEAKGAAQMARVIKATGIQLKVSRSYSEAGKGVISRSSFEEAKKGSCTHVEKAVVVQGEGRGAVITVCRDKKCKKHLGKYGASSTRNDDTDRWQKQQAARERKKQLDRAIRGRIVAALLQHVPATLGVVEMGVIANRLYDRSEYELQKSISVQMGWVPKKSQGSHTKNLETVAKAALAKMSKADLARFILFVVLTSEVQYGETTYGLGRQYIKTLAKEYSVNTTRIGNDFARDQALKKKAKAGKLVAGVCRFCRCTETSPCSPPCAWADRSKTLCSAAPCVAKAKAQSKPKAKAAAAGKR